MHDVPVTPADRRRAWVHIYELAERHRIKVRKAKTRDLSESHIATRQVWVPPRMVSVLDYLIALHEFGHIASPTSRGLALRADYDLDAEVRCEAAAWAWVVKYADLVLLALSTEADWSEVGGWYLGSFLRVGADKRLSQVPA